MGCGTSDGLYYMGMGSLGCKIRFTVTPKGLILDRQGQEYFLNMSFFFFFNVPLMVPTYARGSNIVNLGAPEKALKCQILASTGLEYQICHFTNHNTIHNSQL